MLNLRSTFDFIGLGMYLLIRFCCGHRYIEIFVTGEDEIAKQPLNQFVCTSVLAGLNCLKVHAREIRILCYMRAHPKYKRRVNGHGGFGSHTLLLGVSSPRV